MLFEILFLLGLILLNAVFAMSEIALVTARRTRLQLLAERGDRGAAAALALNEDPTRFLSTIQVGITSIGVLSGIVGEAALAEPLRDRIAALGIDREAAMLWATALVVVIVTYFAIVLGELVPKRLGLLSAEAIARRAARPLHWLSVATKPFVRLLTVSTELLLRLLGARSSASHAVTEEEIHAVIQQGSESGVIAEQERAMVRNVFRLDDRPIASLMTPRADIDFVDLDDPPQDSLRRVLASEHSRFLVCRGGLQDVLGVIDARQLLERMSRGEALDFGADLQPAVFVPKGLTGMRLLELFRKSTAHMAVVLDEYGDVQGLVTRHDVLEAIAGEFETADADGTWAVRRADGSWLLDGLIPVLELKDRLGLEAVPQEGLGRYDTLAGMLMLLLRRVPRMGDQAVWRGWRFEIVDMDAQRIDRVLATREPVAADGARRIS